MCIIGIRVVAKIVIKKSELFRNLKILTGANNRHIALDGGIFMYFKIGDRNTSQMVYVTPDLKFMIFSHRACMELGVIEQTFPERAAQVNKCSASEKEEEDTCSCPARGEVPEPPQRSLGASPVELEKFIKRHFTSSAFNL